MSRLKFLVCSQSGTRLVGTEELRYYADMQPELTEAGNVRANCPNCNGAVSTFEVRYNGKEFGYVAEQKLPIYRLMRCAGCGRGGVATIRHTQGYKDHLLEFYPMCIEIADIPRDVPEAVSKELREAELCMSVKANRAASALLRSCLEKALKDTGYSKKGTTLEDKINEAAKDRVLTDSRKQRAHDNIRDLGNDVVHDEWRQIDSAEVESSRHYVVRVLEDLYDDRPRVLALVKNKETKTE